MFPSIDTNDVGLTGLFYLLISYGYILYTASNLISRGSDLLLLVPSLAGLVGGIILPLLGAIPDGSIMLFSGLGSHDKAQETLSIGVGALAGSTIMLLTIPWALSIYSGRVDLDPKSLKPQYHLKKTKTLNSSIRTQLDNTGVAVTDCVRNDGAIMLYTTVPYFFIQIPAFFLHGSSNYVAKGEKYWALLGLILCIAGFLKYFSYQIRISNEDHDKFKRMEVVKDLIQKGEVSLSGALRNILNTYENSKDSIFSNRSCGYSSIADIDTYVENEDYPHNSVKVYLEMVLKGTFIKYDKDCDSTLSKAEVYMFFRDFNEHVTDDEIDTLFEKYDSNGNGTLDYDEFVGACYCIIKQSRQSPDQNKVDDIHTKVEHNVSKNIMCQIDDEEVDDNEEEDIPYDISQLPPEHQQISIKKKAFLMLFLGTLLVLVFSNPMIGVIQSLAIKTGISPFYVSFVLAPLASNASEILASQYYAAKKTKKTISVAFSALQGAASMNNTFCLSIFMGLIYFRGLAWKYSAETMTILLIQGFMYCLTRNSVMTLRKGLVILTLFPLSITFVALLELIGLD